MSRINVLTLIIWGAQDQLIPLAAGRKMSSLIKDSKLVIFDSCGHLPQEEMPARVVDEMTQFIAEQNQAFSLGPRASRPPAMGPKLIQCNRLLALTHSLRARRPRSQ